MKHLLTPLLGALTLSLSGCQDKPQPQFIRVENGRFVGGSANSGYFVGANFWYGALLATEGPGRDRDRVSWSGRKATRESYRKSNRSCKPHPEFTMTAHSTGWIS